MSVLQNRTPFGGQRGTASVIGEGIAALFETGIWPLLWKVLNDEPFGPNGKKGVVFVSDAMMDVPSTVWLVLTTRGGERDILPWSLVGWESCAVCSKWAFTPLPSVQYARI